MCKECNEVRHICNGDKMFYNSFDELTDDLKKKLILTTDKKCDVTRIKKGYVKFVNLLNKNGDILISTYKKKNVNVKIKYGKCGHTSKVLPQCYFNGNSCKVCLNQEIQRGVNDIATTHPHLVKYFHNVEDAYTHSIHSGKIVPLKCPDCGYERNDTKIDTFSSQGFSCPRCSDKITYPEKFMMCLLDNLHFTYKREMSYDNGKHRYDFLLNGIIVEMHGMQHYKDAKGKWCNYKKEHDNDIYKYDLAVINGHEYGKTYFVIDCRYSNLEWIKSNIISSGLLEVLNINEQDIDWKEIGTKIENNKVKEVCDYFNKTKAKTSEIAKIFNISRETITKYLKKGNQLGWCKYNPKENMSDCGKEQGKKNGKPVIGINIETGETVKFSSASQAGKWLGKSGSEISNCCNGGTKKKPRISAYGYYWKWDTDDSNAEEVA